MSIEQNLYLVFLFASLPFLFPLIISLFIINELMVENINTVRVKTLFIVAKFTSILFVFIGVVFPYFKLVEIWFDVPHNYGYLFALSGWLMWPILIKGSRYSKGNNGYTGTR